MKKIDLSRSFKGTADTGMPKLINVNENQLMFYSAPSSANNTPTGANSKKTKLEPIIKESLFNKKAYSEEHSTEGTSSIKSSSFLIKSSIKKITQFSRDYSDSDSDVGSPIDAGNKNP